MDGCGRAVLARGLCRAHYARWWRKRDVRPDAPIGCLKGVGYEAIHARLRDQRGRAALYLCTDCGKGARCWSYCNCDPDELVDRRGLRYSLDLDRYVPRCDRCHILYDLAERRSRRNRAAGAA